MKKQIITTVLFLVISHFANSQTFKATYDPTTSFKDAGFGFFIDFEFEAQGLAKNSNSTIIVLKSMKINFDKGYYKKYYAQPQGKYYTCAQLNGLCNETIVSNITLGIDWEYDGKIYHNGKQFDGRQVGSKFELVNIPNYYSPSSDIPFKEQKLAVIKKISIGSCSVNTTDRIESIVGKINKM